MNELTEQQRRELAATDAVQLLDPETGKTYVLVPSEIYERLKNLLEEEPGVTGEMVDRLMVEEDRDDPTLAYYQERYGRLAAENIKYHWKRFQEAKTSR